MSNLSLRNVVKSYGSVHVIKNVDLEIKAGEFVVFVGPSGCGKSTLLRMIAGLESISSGELKIGERLVNDIDPSNRGIAMVFQTYALYPHMNVRENMALALKFAKVPKEEIDRRVNAAAKSLELGPLMDRKPKDLSGGQRQRVAIGRAIVRDPKVFLFDEPLSNLDAELRIHMRLEISRLHERLKSTMIYVTHDQVEAMTLADKIVVLRSGKIEQVGAPLDLYDNPDNIFVAGFMGAPKMNFMEAEVENADGGGAQFNIPIFGNKKVSLPVASARKGQKVKLGVRPEHFVQGGLGRAATDVDMHIELLEQLGGDSYAYARINGSDLITVEAENGRALKTGGSIRVALNPEKVLAFDDGGLRLR